jgi:hypothetical protein
MTLKPEICQKYNHLDFCATIHASSFVQEKCSQPMSIRKKPQGDQEIDWLQSTAD